MYSWAASAGCTVRSGAARKGAYTAVIAPRELSGFLWGAMTGNMGA
jgi:hypothetical protein